MEPHHRCCNSQPGLCESSLSPAISPSPCPRGLRPYAGDSYAPVLVVEKGHPTHWCYKSKSDSLLGCHWNFGIFMPFLALKLLYCFYVSLSLLISFLISLDIYFLWWIKKKKVQPVLCLHSLLKSIHFTFQNFGTTSQVANLILLLPRYQLVSLGHLCLNPSWTKRWVNWEGALIANPEGQQKSLICNKVEKIIFTKIPFVNTLDSSLAWG